ncbi:unnamed protein product [Peniophora sp. CBMAI 1063]|nr:unnamed protein product [Peniophora sp. CBMAI 1063]
MIVGEPNWETAMRDLYVPSSITFRSGGSDRLRTRVRKQLTEQPADAVLPRRFDNYAVQLVPGVILYYDYLLTIGDEVTYYWPNRSFTWLSALFLATRYATLLSFSTVFISMLSGSATVK